MSKKKKKQKKEVDKTLGSISFDVDPNFLDILKGIIGDANVEELANLSKVAPQQTLSTENVLVSGTNKLGQTVALTHEAYNRKIIGQNRDIKVEEILEAIKNPLVIYKDKLNLHRVRSYCEATDKTLKSKFVAVVTGTDNLYDNYDANVITAFRESKIKDNASDLLYKATDNE